MNDETKQRFEQMQEMQKKALSGKKELCRPVVIGDVVEELNNRVVAYLRFSTKGVVWAMEQATKDFSKYMHAAVIELPNIDASGTEFFTYNN